MPFTMFHDRFPDLAERETRTMTVLRNTTLPPDTYALIENYCDEPGCDCRRVIFNILAEKRNEIVAVIAYGWESEDYYREWSSHKEPDVLRELQGPVLNRLSLQSELAPTLLNMVKEVVLNDRRYIERLKEHYRLFKAAVDGIRTTATPESRLKKIGRNDPCPCGSGRKYKHCCLKRAHDSRLGE
jgi:hypothetical protein